MVTKSLNNAVLVLAIILAAAAAPAQECETEFSGTYELIQEAVFENRGCTNDLCHGSAVSGGLDLRAGASYDSLIDQAAGSVIGAFRVVPGQKDESLLYVNLAAKTLPEEWSAPLRAMPLGADPAISLDELEAIREWIEYGAPREGVVPGTDELLDACLPPAEPIKIPPLPAPAVGEGVQLRMPPWVLPPQSEDEVCFTSYFDFTDQVDPKYLNGDGTMIRINASQIRQDPLSHHLISSVYAGAAAPNDPAWGTFTCKGGPIEGQACDPTDTSACGDGGGCATDPESWIACIGYGPRDANFGFSGFGITGVQETAAQFDFAPGVFFEYPVKGTIVWNSHAFNLTQTAGSLEARINLIFAEPEEQLYEVQRIFDVSQIFKMNVPAFSTDEVCHFYRFPRNANLFELNSHMHQRGKRFRMWNGEFACEGGPKNGQACAPQDADADHCAGAPCRSLRALLPGDCNHDESVTVNEIVLGVRIALGVSDVEQCPDHDVDSDASVVIAELVQSVRAALTGESVLSDRNPASELMYTSLLYNDPLTLRFDPPRVYPAAEASQRTLTYCALYDNGFSNPDEVKTKSGSPEPPGGVGLTIGGPCDEASHCTEGLVGQPCSGSSEAARHVSCDTSPGAGDGLCDACTLLGGVTTEDEMFVLFGAYFVPDN